MYSSSYKDHDNPSERSPSASSSMDEDSEMKKSNANSSDGLMDVESPIQFVIGPDGLREFILQPLWTVNDFNSKIKETHFKTLRDKFQIPDNIPMRLPYKTEKCYYEGLKDISPNAWRVFLSVEVMYGAMSDGARRLTVEEFFNCYHPAEIAQSKGMYSFVPRRPPTLIETGRVGIFS